MQYEEEKLNDLNYKFELEDKYIYVNNNDNSKYMVKSPYLKVLKAKHEFKNKNYLIVQLDQDLDTDEQMDSFIKKIRAIDEYSKEILLNNSKNWYGKKWDIYTLDSMTRYPIDEQKGILYMKIIINKENKDLNKNIETLEKIIENNKEVYISVQTFFKGLRWSREIFTEEWYLEDFIILEEENDDLLLENLIKNIEEKNKKEEVDNKEILENNQNISQNKDILENEYILENNQNISQNKDILENEYILENNQNISQNEDILENNQNISQNEDILENEHILENNQNISQNEDILENEHILENNENVSQNEDILDNKHILENEYILENEDMLENKKINNQEENKKYKIKKNKNQEDEKSSISTSSSKVKKRFILNGKIIK